MVNSQSSNKFENLVDCIETTLDTGIDFLVSHVNQRSLVPSRELGLPQPSHSSRSAAMVSIIIVECCLCSLNAISSSSDLATLM